MIISKFVYYSSFSKISFIFLSSHSLLKNGEIQKLSIREKTILLPNPIDTPINHKYSGEVIRLITINNYGYKNKYTVKC